MNTVTDIFDQCGGTSAFARMLGVGTSTAGEMKRRQSIPVEYWPRLVRAAHSQGVEITNDILVQVHTTDDDCSPVTPLEPHEA